MADVTSIQFGVLSDADIVSISACKIDKPSLNTDRGGLYDPRLGCTRNDINCASCGENVWKCSGHFGYIELATPVILYHKQAVYLLKCFCLECCRLLASEKELAINNATESTRVAAYLHSLNMCSHCKAPVPDIKYTATDSTITATLKLRNSKATRILEPSFIKSIFDAISEEDVLLLKLDTSMVHPSNYVLTKFPVLPICCRPKMVAGDNVCDDDLTLMLLEIIKSNNYILTHNYKDDVTSYTKAVEIIRSRTLAYCDNSRKKVTHNTNHKPLTGIKERINCKTGLVRQHLTGKRCNRTARTVIGPDPTLKLDEVAVPVDIAAILTIPEYVSPLNIDKLTLSVNSGKASTIIKRNGVRLNVFHARICKGTRLLSTDVLVRNNQEYRIFNCKMQLLQTDLIKRNGVIMPVTLPAFKKIKLEYGDVVERYLQDGDPIYLNRQPTLHRSSMLGMKVVIKPGKTVRFNLSITKALNADFDGDEGNLFCCESLPANAELLHIVSSRKHMLSAQSPKPEMCFVQDSLLAAYLMTAKPILMNARDFEQCLFRTNKYHTYTRCEKLYSTNLFDYLLPDDFFYTNPNITIEHGKIISGYLDKMSLGTTSSAIVRYLILEYSKDVAAEFIDNVQFVTNAWLEIFPFSIGLDDCLVNHEAIETIKQTIQRYFIEANAVGKTIQDRNVKEAKINMSLNKGKDIGLRIAKNAMAKSNKILDTVISGSKGDFFNITQITGLLGQQNLNNSRPEPSLTNNTRTLIHYPHVITDSDQLYESRGFVSSNFSLGLNPKELWFHAMTGREGMISTALKTATSGYIQRSTIKLNEDLKVEYDGTIRDASGGIHQFMYGNTGFDPSIIAIDGMPVDIERLCRKINSKYDNTQLRSLTTTEIDDICNKCQSSKQIPHEVWITVWTKHETKLRHVLGKIQIVDSEYNNFRDFIINKYLQGVACPGESVGIIGAQSIGEIQTQSNLNTFHTAGKFQTNGVDRFEEILKLTKTLKYPKMMIYLKQKYATAKELRLHVNSSIVGLKLGQVVKDVEHLSSDSCKYKYKIHLKKSVLFSIYLSPDTIMDCLENTYSDLRCECDLLSITISIGYPTKYSKKKVSVTIDEDGVSKKQFDETQEQVYIELSKTRVCGIEGITEMFIDKTDDGEYYIITSGSNLRKVLLHPLVDISRLYTNNVWEMYECLGVAATKRMIIKDLKDCISGVNDCHLRLLADKMTFKGKPFSITRYTMRVNDVGALSKATFEQSVDIIQSASFKGEIDNLNGISSAIVAGNQIRAGTGMVDLMIDYEKMMDTSKEKMDDGYVYYDV